MIVQEKIHWKPLGKGRISPPESIPDKKLAERLIAYKNQVAGRYRSVAPHDILKTIPQGEHIISPKMDGETWFLYTGSGEVWLVSPSGKIITDVPATDEAKGIIKHRHVLLAGELYANGQPTRPRVHDLHAALGGGADAGIHRLHFAAFDLLGNGNNNQHCPFAERAQQLMKLLSVGKLCHSVPFEKVLNADGVLNAYERLVTRRGHEGIVVRSADNQILKIKPLITIDAVVVGCTERIRGGIAELLLALQRPNGAFQLLGRVEVGFSKAERFELARRLQPLAAQSSYLAVARSGALFQFLQPELVVEVKCNDLLAVRSNGESVRRMALEYSQGGWQPLRPLPAVSLINAVFRRIREDKTVGPDSTGMRQVADLVPIVDACTSQSIQLPHSTVIKREVFSKDTAAGLCIRKLVAWKTNKENVNHLYPPYVIFFTDFTPGRLEPLKTQVSVASSVNKINSLAESWLAEKITRGWNRQSMSDTEQRLSPLSLPASCSAGKNFCLNLEISFARTPSVNFPVAVRRIKALQQAGKLIIENDDKDEPRHYTLAFEQNTLVENIRRIESLYRLIGRWKGAEFLVNNDPLSYHDFQGVINTINDIAACWRMQKRNEHTCRTYLALCCKQLRFKPASSFPGIAQEEPAWYAMGKFDGKIVTLDKDSLLAQLDTPINEPLEICPLFDRKRVIERIKGLPEKLDPTAKSNRWVTGYFIESNKPAWVFPKNIRKLPFGITLEPRQERTQKTWPSVFPSVGVQNNQGAFGLTTLLASAATHRQIPSTRYADLCGQDTAVEMVRDYAELPLLHPELFQQVGVKPGRGILLYGPPGNGKTLLARAVAGESGAHIETVCGPELLSKWIGETERMLREIFRRADQFAPSVIILDEVDAIAGSRSQPDASYLREIVSQLLVLMDGLSERGRILIIATTNCPDYLDAAILRPGRIDRKIFMGPPDKKGRTALFKKLLYYMPTADDVQTEVLADLTPGFSGAEVEHLTNEAGLLAVKEAIANNTPTDIVQVSTKHFLQAINTIERHSKPSTSLSYLTAPI